MTHRWRAKHPCASCGTGYGFCISGWAVNLMCCASCNHPTRWQPKPYTDQDYAEMGVETK